MSCIYKHSLRFCKSPTMAIKIAVEKINVTSYHLYYVMSLTWRRFLVVINIYIVGVVKNRIPVKFKSCC